MKYIEKMILNELNKKLKIKDRIILFVFKKYTYKVYKQGFKDGFNLKG